MTPPPPTRRHARLHVLFAVVTAIACASLLGIATLVPAPPVVLPLLVLICIGFPMVAAYELPQAVAALRAEASLSQLRRSLARLPEAEHPLGL